MSNESPALKHVIEAALLVAGRPLNFDALLGLFDEMERPERGEMRAALDELQQDFADRGIELKEIASGYRIQVRASVSARVSRLFEERPQRYSRALLETLALIAYRQPLTRGEIEDVRGVSVSSNIMKTLQDRGWVRVVGHRDVPGRPALYATTREFLDYFGLKSLDELPTLAELRDIDSINVEIDFDGAEEAVAEAMAEQAATGADAAGPIEDDGDGDGEDRPQAASS
ncbi:MAG TPA: SMC-Scp complex subunit ScpB [Gammaproteobacteria bacterium]|nr:SMC-Scp complex subunit ScpB [Gammaproteobacteria bacterium]